MGKSWCKFDNYPQTFMMGHNVDPRMYADSKWYAQGLPLVFYSSHATKDVEYTDWLVTVLSHCFGPDAQLHSRPKCPDAGEPPSLCNFRSPEEQWARLRHPDICCCVEP